MQLLKAMSSSWDFLSADNLTVQKTAPQVTSNQPQNVGLKHLIEIFPETDEKILLFSLTKGKSVEETIDYIISGEAQFDYEKFNVVSPTTSIMKSNVEKNRSKLPKVKLPNEHELANALDDTSSKRR